MRSTGHKVVHVVGHLQHGGAEMLVVDLLPRLRERGIDVGLIALSDANPLADGLARRGVPVVTLGHPGGTIYRLDRWIPTAWRLRRRLEAESPLLIHSHIFMADLVTCLAAPQRARVVSTVHGPPPWWTNSVRLRSRLKTFLDATLVRRRDVRLIAVSQDTAAAAAQAIGVGPERIRVIYNGIDPNTFPFNPSRSFPSDSSAPVLIQVGRMDILKGHSVALDAFPPILKKFPGASLLFVGDGPLRTQLETKARVLSLDGRVQFLGVRDDVPALLSRSDLFWMPSRSEGLPVACLEAMACGLPVVSTNVGGLREVVVDGVTGSLVDADSPAALAGASLRVLQDPALARGMGIAGHGRVTENFSIEKTADGYAQAYEDILNGRW